MSTRNLIMVVDRRHASDVEQGFSRDPEEVASHSYVNMYMHHDGYPEWNILILLMVKLYTVKLKKMIVYITLKSS
jgi:hypothetical protein